MSQDALPTVPATTRTPYVGRFAPSPSGPLHAGSLVAAMASWLDARAHEGRWLLRIEDVDTPRMVPGAAETIMQQLRALGMHWDDEPVWQSHRDAAYLAALARLQAANRLYPCACTRREIADAANAAGRLGANGEKPYLGMCRHGLAPGREPRAWRVRLDSGVERFEDRWLGWQSQDVAEEVGDVVLRRADGLWAYQLAVVVDDGEQGITDIVRGADLLTSTARQIALGRLLGYPTLRYMHVPLVMDPASGLKLSKQNHAPALALDRPLQALSEAWRALGFGAMADASDISDFWQRATTAWAARWRITS